MMFRKTLVGLLVVLCVWIQFEAGAQVSYNKIYWGNQVELATFSSSILSKAVKSDEITTLRVNSIFNIGFTLHRDFSGKVGIYTGAGIKNIGFIEKDRKADSTIKRRAYTLEVPLGIKIGNLYKRKFIMLGGGVNLAFNYKEKTYVRRGNKDKFNEWFSDRTPLVMPFVFAGVSFDPGLTLKLQYYPQNFLNTDYVDKATGVKPYAGYNVNLLLLSVGIDIHHHSPPRQTLKQAKGMM